MGLTLLESAQAQKEVTINEALARIDAVLNVGVIDRHLATPPGSPNEGDVYIVASGAMGAWSGKDAQVAYFDQVWRFIEPNEGLTLWVADEDAHFVFNGSAWVMSGGGGGGGGGDMDGAVYDPASIAEQVVGVAAVQTLSNKTLQSPLVSVALRGVVPLVVEGRLTLTSAVAVTSSDVTGAGTVYYTPYKGTHIALYDTGASVWGLHAFSQISITVPSTTHTNYDVFLYLSSGSVVAETVAWSNDTTRATALALQNGVYVKSGNAARRYVGSFRTTAVSGQCEDSREKRFVWNYYNRVARPLMRTESTVSWSYSTATNRYANGNSANQVAVLVGVVEDAIPVGLFANVTNSSGTPRAVVCGIGVNSSTSYATVIGSVQNAYPVSGQFPIIIASISGLAPSVGLTAYTWIERGAGADTQTWYGNNAYGLMGHCYG